MIIGLRVETSSVERSATGRAGAEIACILADWRTDVPRLARRRRSMTLVVAQQGRRSGPSGRLSGSGLHFRNAHENPVPVLQPALRLLTYRCSNCPDVVIVGGVDARASRRLRAVQRRLIVRVCSPVGMFVAARRVVDLRLI